MENTTEQPHNLVLYDWISLTSKIHTHEDMTRLIGLPDVNWEETKGAHGYKKRLYFQGISIHYDGAENQGVWLEMSGQGCRTFESYAVTTYETLFSVVARNSQEMHFTRIDVAFDDHTGILPLDEICRDTRNGEYLSKSNAWEVTESWKGQTVYIGSPTSDVRIRIYDKARERNCDPGTHWVRVELQLRDDRARVFTSYDMPLGKTFAGVLVNYLRYVIPEADDTNRSRWLSKPYWDNLIQDACRLSVYEAVGVDYNLDRLRDNVCYRNGNAIATYIECVGFGQFIEDLHNDKPKTVNPKYTRLIDELELARKKRIETTLSTNKAGG